MNENQIAIMEGEIAHASDKYFAARPQADTAHNRHIFEAGFERGYKVKRPAITSNED